MAESSPGDTDSDPEGSGSSQDGSGSSSESAGGATNGTGSGSASGTGDPAGVHLNCETISDPVVAAWYCNPHNGAPGTGGSDAEFVSSDPIPHGPVHNTPQ